MLVAFLSIGMSGFAPPASSVVLPRAAPPALGKALALRGGGVGEFFGSSWPEVGVTFGTYIAADFLSNFLQHPGQKMDYGFLNKVIGREVDEEWWGTRTQHILGVAACLALTDHASQKLFSDHLGKALSFADTPAAFIVHTFAFIFAGVAIYVALDSAYNPSVQDRKANFREELYNTYVGTNTAWFEPFVAGVAAKLFSQEFADSWWGGSLLPATLAYATVKGVGWNDWGTSGLNALETKLLSGSTRPASKRSAKK